ncbi:MAG: hypothetical protein Q7S48_05280 [bacterium]|nr:hypothetical protein [bacterium]
MQRELGDVKFAALVSSSNTEAVSKFAETLVGTVLPTEITIGGRVYEILSILKGDEKSVKGSTMVACAKEANAHLGKEDGRNLLDNWQDIPAAFDNISFVFTDWPHPGHPEGITIIYRNGDHWIRRWGWLDRGWDGDYRVLCRKSPA